MHDRSPRTSSHEAPHIVRPQPEGLVMTVCILELREYLLVAQRRTIRVDIRVAAANVEQGHHLLNVFRNDQGMRLAGWLERIIPSGCHPVVFEIPPPAG